MSFSPGWRRALLTLHVATSVGFIGAVAAFLALAIAGVSGAPAVYLALPIITWPVIVPLAVLSLVFGVVQSLGTPWGLVRHYWVLVKLVLTLVALIVLLLQTGTIETLAALAAAGRIGPATLDGQMAMVIHSAGGLVVLLGATVLSTYKPRGLTGLTV